MRDRQSAHEWDEMLTYYQKSGDKIASFAERKRGLMSNTSEMLSGVFRKFLLLAIAGMFSCPQAAISQVGAAPAAGQKQGPNSLTAKPLRFEVVSIRPNKSGGPSALQILPDGYRAINMSLGNSVMMAYIPQNLWLSEPIEGKPAWFHTEMYDVTAMIAPSDVEEWRKQSDNQNKMLEAMLQTALAERCKLIVHHVPREGAAWALVVDKKGPKFKQAKPDETVNGQPVPDEGKSVGFPKDGKPQVTFYGYTMDNFAAWLSHSSPTTPVLNKTGLAGKFDLVASQIDRSSPNGVAISLNNSDPSNIWDLKALGLKIVPVKFPMETIVIDHIERPSAN